RSVHGIDVVLPRARVAPQDVALPVAVEVRDADHFPVEIGDAAQVALGRLDRESVHRIEVVLAGDCMSPQDVILAVAVEVADPCDLPVLVGYGPDEALGGCAGGPV